LFTLSDKTVALLFTVGNVVLEKAVQGIWRAELNCSAGRSLATPTLRFVLFFLLMKRKNSSSIISHGQLKLYSPSLIFQNQVKQKKPTEETKFSVCNIRLTSFSATSINDSTNVSRKFLKNIL